MIPLLLSGKMAAGTDHHHLFIFGMWQQRQSRPFSRNLLTQQHSGASRCLHQEGWPWLFFIPDAGNCAPSSRGGSSGDDLWLFWEPVLVLPLWLEHILHSVMTQCLVLITGSNFSVQLWFDRDSNFNDEYYFTGATFSFIDSVSSCIKDVQMERAYFDGAFL